MTCTEEELQKRIQYLRDVHRLSFRQIAREIGIAREKCSRLYSGNLKGHLIRPKLLDEYRELIAQWYQERPSLKAIQIFDRLKQRNVDVSYATVSEHTRQLRRKKAKCYWTLEFLPAEEAQVDWFFFTHPRLGKLCGFALILSFSRYLCCHIFPRHSFEFFIQGHLQAFEQLGGLPQALRYDNLKSVVLKKYPLSYNPAFLEFAKHFHFDIRLCNLAAGNEKGRVERVIRTIKERFCDTSDHHQSLAALNLALQQWVAEKNNTRHRTTEKTPHELRQQEQLKPLSIFTWRNCSVLAPKLPSKTGLLTFDTNHYSVPHYCVGQSLSVHAFCDRLEIFSSKQDKVATHPRSFERNKTFINPLHRSVARLSSKAKAERIYCVIKNLDPLTSSFLERNKQAGQDPLTCAYYIFSLLRSHSRQTILSAIRRLLRSNTPHINALAELLSSPASAQPVLPQKRQLLELDYQPRPLEDYQHDTTKS